jgi:hypothetical protein
MDAPVDVPLPLEEFDFTVLDSSEFKEDSVREEIINPVLKGLGYRVSGPNRIIRSKGLEHPFLTVGAKKMPVTRTRILRLHHHCSLWSFGWLEKS